MQESPVSDGTGKESAKRRKGTSRGQVAGGRLAKSQTVNCEGWVSSVETLGKDTVTNSRWIWGAGSRG